MTAFLVRCEQTFINPKLHFSSRTMPPNGYFIIWYELIYNSLYTALKSSRKPPPSKSPYSTAPLVNAAYPGYKRFAIRKPTMPGHYLHRRQLLRRRKLREQPTRAWNLFGLARASFLFKSLVEFICLSRFRRGSGFSCEARDILYLTDTCDPCSRKGVYWRTEGMHLWG